MIIGITGGIGSGKSTVCEILQVLGYPVFNADKEAKTIYQDKNFISELIQRWPKVVINGRVDLKSVSEIVFNNPNELAWLNSKIHPFVDHLFQQWMHKQNGNIFFKEAAILVETGGFKKCDKLIVVEAPEEVRINRAVLRDKSNSTQIEQRIKNQITDEQRRVYADFIITNHQKLLVPQVLNILQTLQKS